MPAAAEARPGDCAQRGVTVAASSVARVFETDRDGDRALFACLRGTGRLQRLATWFSCDCSVGDDPAPSARLFAGRFVALEIPPSCGPLPCLGDVTVRLRDLRTRVEVRPTGPVTEVVRGRGFFVFGDGRVVIVRGGRERIVDEGPVEPRSIAVAGRRVYWTRDGVPRSVAD